MKAPDLDKERSERKISVTEFLASYNTNLPDQFPRASLEYLSDFRAAYPSLFRGDSWSLDVHRKKFMDWLPQHIQSILRKSARTV